MKSLRLHPQQLASLLDVLDRIAGALEQLTAGVPPTLPQAVVPQVAPAPLKPSVRVKAKSGIKAVAQADTSPAGTAMIAESGEEYDERLSSERSLALLLGVAPWSPDFQTAINEMRADLLKRKMVQEQDEEGNWHWVAKQFTEEEADEIVRESFRLAGQQGRGEETS